MKKLRIGVVGVGHIGSNHARLYAEIPSAEFTAVYDVDLTRGNAIGRKFEAAPTKSLDEFIDMVDAASVATPTYTHYEIARSLLGRGKHVLVEKPITDNTAHAPVLSIDAVGVPVLSRGEDIANARLRFENGCVANVTSSRMSPERRRKIRVFQEDAYLSLDYQNQSGEIYRRVGSRITRDKVEIEREEPLKRQLTSFIESAGTGRKPRVSGFEATAALELAVEITKRIAPSK